MHQKAPWTAVYRESLRELLDLAPLHLPTYRGTRYQGDDERRLLTDFAPADQDILKGVYFTLLQLYRQVKPVYHEPPATFVILQKFIAAEHDLHVSEQMRLFGRASLARTSGIDCARPIHDLRGGAFQSLSLRMELLRSFPEISRSMQSIFFLLRDHLKIMRNCVADLDLDLFVKDAAKQDHAAALLVEKWSMAEFTSAKRPIDIVLRCLYEGTLCESCLEFSTLDRIIYNLINNAAKNSADDVVSFTVLPIPEDDPKDVRFVVANTVTPEHRAALAQAFPANLSEIFHGGFSTGGHGIGLRICADFCAQAYGITHFEEARDAGHFGAKMIRDQFVAWFHWPVVAH